MKIDQNEDGVGRAFPRPMGYDNGSGTVQAVAAATPLPVAATIAGSTATSRLLSAAATDNPTIVKASAGTLTQINGFNAAASPRFLKVYDKATAPTSGDTPRMTLYLPPGASFVFDCLDVYAAGIGYRITGAAADADATALTAGDILCLNVDYR